MKIYYLSQRGNICNYWGDHIQLNLEEILSVCAVKLIDEKGKYLIHNHVYIIVMENNNKDHKK